MDGDEGFAVEVHSAQPRRAEVAMPAMSSDPVISDLPGRLDVTFAHVHAVRHEPTPAL